MRCGPRVCGDEARMRTMTRHANWGMTKLRPQAGKIRGPQFRAFADRPSRSSQRHLTP